MTGRPTRKRTIPARLRDTVSTLVQAPKENPVKETLKSQEKSDSSTNSSSAPLPSVDPIPAPPPPVLDQKRTSQVLDSSDEEDYVDFDEDDEIDLISNVQNTSSHYPNGPPNKTWSVPELKEFLKVQKKKTSQMNKPALLQLASLTFSSQSKIEFTPSDIAKLRKEESDLIEKRKIFDSNLQWDDIENCSNIIIPKEFDIDIVNTFLRSSYITIRDKLVHSEVEKPNVKGRNLYFSDVIQRCQVASNQELLFFRAEIGASMKNLIR